MKLQITHMYIDVGSQSIEGLLYGSNALHYIPPCTASMLSCNMTLSLSLRQTSFKSKYRLAKRN